MTNDRLARIQDHDEWATADGETDTGEFVIRFRAPVVEPDEGSSHSTNLTVLWTFAEEGAGTMPDDACAAAMETFEDRLSEAWEDDGLAFLAAAVTFDGARQWVFYTRDAAACGERLEAMTAGEERLPIELTAEEDPQWSYLHQDILGTVDWREHQEEWEAALAEFGT